MRDIGDVLVRYFDVRRFLGRGGRIRFFLRAKHVKHIYEALEAFQELPDQLQQLQHHLMTTGGSPTGQLPILQHEGHTFCETNAILRYLAKRLGDYGTDTYKDYMSDMTMDKLAYWSDDLMSAISEANAGGIGQAMTTYIKARANYYTLFERLVGLGQASVASDVVASPTWMSCSIAATLFDDLQLMALGRRLSGENLSWVEDPQERLKACPRLAALFQTLCEYPLIKNMLVEKEAIRLYEEEACDLSSLDQKKQHHPSLPPLLNEQMTTKATTTVSSTQYEPPEPLFPPISDNAFDCYQRYAPMRNYRTFEQQQALPVGIGSHLHYTPTGLWHPCGLHTGLAAPSQLTAISRPAAAAWGSYPLHFDPRPSSFVWEGYPSVPMAPRDTTMTQDYTKPPAVPNPATLSVPHLQERPIQADRPSSIRSSRADVQTGHLPPPDNDTVSSFKPDESQAS